MNDRTLVDRIADSVLYEGYILYPYRPSIKNHSRWTFGGLYPEDYCRAQTQGGTDASSQRTECLVLGTPATTVEARVRFLHLTARRVGEFAPPLGDWPESAATEPASRPVETLRAGDRLFHSWQEAEEREVILGDVSLGDLAARSRSRAFEFLGGRWCEPIRGPVGDIVGVLVREQAAVRGRIEAEAAEVAPGLFRLTVRVVNQSLLEGAGAVASRDEALLRTLVSTHTVLTAHRGEFVSLLDPPDCWREAAASCRNEGTWPVLVGVEGQKDTILSSPIILYDYPQLAPESPGDFFDGTEIDEMLTLRILTLTDEEKGAMAALDDRVRALLARTEAMAPEQLRGLHGTLRGLRTLPSGGSP